MRNTKKIKFFSILLAVTLLLTALPLTTALADDAGQDRKSVV